MPVVRFSSRAPINLANTADFEIGGLRVRPAARELETAAGVQRIEPRVMQALISLCEAGGEIVSRDELIARCWAGAVVGDDAINRVIQKLRRLATLDGEGRFEIQTIPRVGYRLKPVETDASRTRPLLDSTRQHWRSLIAAAIGVLAVVGVLALRTSTYRLNEIEMVARSPLLEFDPALSPDGRLLVYSTQSGPSWPSNADLFIRDLATGVESRLTDTPQYLEHASAFSPSGDRLAHVRAVLSDQTGAMSPCEIVMRVFPQGVDRLVGACEIEPFTPRLSWTPDGRALVFSDRVEGAWRVQILDLAGGGARDLVPASASGGDDLLPTVSPDGRRVAFVRYGAVAAGDVYVYDLFARTLSRVTRRNTWTQVAWADERRLFVVSTTPAEDAAELWLHDADARAVGERLLPGLARMRRPVVANGVLALEFDASSAFIRRLGAAGDLAGAETSVRGESPDFSRDGVLAFIDGAWLILQAPGDEPRRLARLTGSGPHGLRWSPDGRRLVYSASLNGRAQLFAVDAASGAVSEVPVRWPGVMRHASWSPDGRSLVLTAYSPEGARLLRVSFTGGITEEISEVGWAEAIETPDGVLARSTSRPGIWKLAPGQQPQQVFPEPRLPASAHYDANPSIGWTVDGVSVYALSNASGGWQLFSGTLGGDSVRAVDIGDDCTGAVTVDPRTGEIAYGGTSNQSDIGIVRFRRT